MAEILGGGSAPDDQEAAEWPVGLQYTLIHADIGTVPHFFGPREIVEQLNQKALAGELPDPPTPEQTIE